MSSASFIMINYNSISSLTEPFTSNKNAKNI